MKRILTNQIIVAPSGTPHLVYGLRILEFELPATPEFADKDIEEIYRSLISRHEIPIATWILKEFERESHSLLISEHPLLLTQSPTSHWHLSLP